MLLRNLISTIWSPAFLPCFIAGMQSVSLVIKMIRSTEHRSQKVAISNPIRMSTPFCSKSALKSESLRAAELTGMRLGL